VTCRQTRDRWHMTHSTTHDLDQEAADCGTRLPQAYHNMQEIRAEEQESGSPDPTPIPH
jgi:hypothetical protein